MTASETGADDDAEERDPAPPGPPRSQTPDDAAQTSRPSRSTEPEHSPKPGEDDAPGTEPEPTSTSEDAGAGSTAFDAGLEAIHEEHLRRERLRNRHEGLAWLIWGLVTPMVFFTFEAAGLLLEQGPLAGALGAGGQYPWWIVLVWIPWILAGALAVHLLWRSAVVRDPDIREGRPSVPLVATGWIVVVALVWAGLRTWLLPGLNSTVYITIGLGVAWGLTGLANPFNLTHDGTRVSTAIGVVVLLAGIVSAFAFPPWPAPGSLYTSWVGAAVTGLAPFVGGLVQIRFCGEEQPDRPSA